MHVNVRPLPIGALRLLLGALLVSVVLVLASCGSGDDDAPTGGATSAGGDAYPVTVDGGAFGSVTIPKAPKRVVTLGWSDQDVALALGVKPVGVADVGSDFPNGVGPWASKQLGDAKPEVISLADGVPFEKIAALRPDLVIAVQAEMTKPDFDKLSQIAPTVTFAKGRQAYLSPWEEQTEIIGKALGQSARATRLVQQTTARIQKAKADHPALDGQTFSYLYDGQSGASGLYLKDDLRVKFLLDLGMKLSSGQDELTKNTKNSFYTEVSLEQLPRLNGDSLIAWFATPAAQKAFTGRAVFRSLRAVKRGGFVPLTLVQAQAQGAPTVLSIPWAIDNVVPLIEKGAKGEGARSR